MTDEPNSRNHHQQHEEQGANAPFLPELEALTARLVADGAAWQRHLPDPAQVAERIRAIPSHSTIHSNADIDSEGDYLMLDDFNSIPENSRPVPLPNKRPASFAQRLGRLALVAVVVALIGSMAYVFYSVRHGNGGPPIVSHPTATGGVGSGPFQVTGVTMAVSPTSIAGIACGTQETVTYTATIQASANNPGGTVQFMYTVNNGRGQTPASVTFAPGQTSKTYSFSWSGQLPPDHTYPGQGGIQITSPNALTSPTVAPTGQCSSPSAFQVTGVTMAVSPTSIAGIACGTQETVTYTATIEVAPNGPGGTVQFNWTTNNGRGQNPASITFAPGETSKTYSFTWSGPLPADHTEPENGAIEVTSPNMLVSPEVAPTGRCS